MEIVDRVIVSLPHFMFMDYHAWTSTSDFVWHAAPSRMTVADWCYCARVYRKELIHGLNEVGFRKKGQ